MKLSCGIVMDLLPLYEEGICSEETKVAVEEHLKDCKRCRSLLEYAKNFPEEEVTVQAESVAENDKIVVKGLKKVRKHWICSIIFVIILLPVCYLGFNEVNKTGVHFTNIREICIGHQFVKELQLGNYEKAFEYLNIEGTKKAFNYMGKKKLENFEEKAYESFMESTEPLKEAGGVKGFQYKGLIASETSNGIHYDMTFVLCVGDKSYNTTFEVSDDGVGRFSDGNSCLDDPIAYLGIWREWLWQDLQGCYFDFEAGEYVWD